MSAQDSEHSDVDSNGLARAGDCTGEPRGPFAAGMSFETLTRRVLPAGSRKQPLDVTLRSLNNAAPTGKQGSNRLAAGRLS